MGTYYRYVNFTRGEFVSLHGLRDGGDKENAAIYCAHALAHLLVQPHALGDGYRGRWRSYGADSPAHDVRIVSDGAFDFYDMGEGGVPWAKEPFLDITPGLLQSLRAAWPGIAEDYHPRSHEVALVTHDLTNGVYAPLDNVCATCKCGWQVGPIYGENRVETLERVVSDHVGHKRSASPAREPREPVYRAELSSVDVCDLIEALDEAIGDDKAAPKLRALRDRLASLRGER